MEFKPYLSLDQQSEEAGTHQLKSRLMSGFVGSKGPEFYGGEMVRALEAKSAAMLGFENAITVNSWTSGLLLMVEALELDDEHDEIIVTPWTMSATVMAIIQAGFMPVFADICEDNFMPTFDSIQAVVTERTRAIMLADIFGQSYAYEELEPFRKMGIRVLSDAAQAHLATRHSRPVGIDADCTGISLNRHKHINTGEGGIILTNDARIAEYCRQARNHGENLSFAETNMKNMIGYNFRLTETQAAIGVSQLDQLEKIVESRRQLAAIADARLKDSKYFSSVAPMPGNEHSYYIYPILVREEYRQASFVAGVKQRVIERGFPSPLAGYQNVHRLDFFQNPGATTGKYARYCTKPSCPVAELLHDRGFMGILLCNTAFNEENLICYIDALEQAADAY